MQRFLFSIVLLTTFMQSGAFAKEVKCFQRQMDGWASPAYYYPTQDGYTYDFSREIYPKGFKPQGQWQSSRMGDRNDNQRKGICLLK